MSTLVMLANENEQSRLYFHRTLDSERQRSRKLVVKNLQLEAELKLRSYTKPDPQKPDSQKPDRRRPSGSGPAGPGLRRGVIFGCHAPSHFVWRSFFKTRYFRRQLMLTPEHRPSSGCWDNKRRSSVLRDGTGRWNPDHSLLR